MPHAQSVLLRSIGKLRSISARHWLFLVLSATTAVVAATAVWASSWRVGGYAAIAFFLYLSMLGIMTLRQLDYKLTRVESGRTKPHAAKSKKGLITRASWGAVGFYAELNARKSVYLGKQIVRSKYVDGRDVLAHVATKGRFGMAHVRDMLDAYRADIKRKAVVNEASRFNGDALREIGRVLYRQDLSLVDRLDAATCYELLFDIHGARAFTQYDVDWFLATWLALRDYESYYRWVGRFGSAARDSVNHPLLMANACNPWVNQNGSYEEWARYVGALYKPTGVPPVHVTDGSTPVISRLVAAHKGKASGPLVTVLMPMHNPGEEARFSVRSIISQSWEELEVIIVDDGSTDNVALFDDFARLDSRVHVVTLPKNRGAYSARNAGLRIARGEFVTCHDADDWAHPMRIESQVRDLVEDPRKIANTSDLCRVDANLEFKNRNSTANPNFVFPAFATLMFRRRPVVERLGYWDSVRKAADSEFISRMKLAFDTEIRSVSPGVPLTFALLEQESLSGRDLFRGFLHPERKIYQARYREWHAQIESGEVSPYMPEGEAARRFMAPPSFLPSVSRPVFDVVFVSELGFTGGNANSLLHEIMICVNAGLRVGIARARNLLFVGAVAEREPIAPLRELITSGTITEISLASDCATDLVIVRWPACFQYVPELKYGVVAQRAIVVANHVPYETNNIRHFYDVQRVMSNVGRVFSAVPKWAPQSAVIRALCAPHLAADQLLDFDWVGVLGGADADLPRRISPVGKVPVIGRHSRDDHLKWPSDRAALLQAYPCDDTISVCVMGGIERLVSRGEVSAEDVAGWTVYEFGAMPPTEFLQKLDFFVYFTHDDLVEAFGRVIMEALASGAVAIVPRQFESIFGDACVYAAPSEVRAIVMELYDDWDRYLVQSRRGQEYVLRNCTSVAYLKRLSRLGVSVSP